MHGSVYQWVAGVVDKRGLANASVLEVGSRNVNGSCRDLFTGRYWGIDAVWGPGVDQVIPIEQADVNEALYSPRDVVLCTEMLEHCVQPWIALDRMRHFLRPGGLLILTCRGYDERGCWPVHDAPDLWRFSRTGLAAMMADAGFGPIVEPDPEGPGWFALGERPARGGTRASTP